LKISREVKTAILILGCVAIFIFGFNYLKGASLLDNSKVVSSIYQDVEGLVIGANVTINGLNVGKVRNIDFDENYDKIKVTFSLRSDLNFSNQSTAQLYEAGLIGGKAIAILPKYDQGSEVKTGDVLPSEIKPGLTELVNQQIAPLQDKIEGLLTSADSLFAGVSNVMNYQTFEQTSADLKMIISRLNNGEGSAGKLLNDDNLYNKLLGSSAALEALLNDLKANPKNYVHFSIFGRKANTTRPSERWKHMVRVALGQSKMGVKPVAAALHLVVYIGFILINIELLEIILDGLLGTHRLFAPLLGSIYDFLIGSFEILAGWPKRDADYILYFEVVLMLLFLSMNATDALLQQQAAESYIKAGSFPVSQFLTPLFEGLGLEALILLERSFWWAHITGIIIFLNYLYYSKHLHILLAFPNTFYANLDSQGKFSIDTDIKREVMLMLFPEKAATEPESSSPPDKFGASDVFDLKWTQLMNAYSCTECGRCTEVCPANQTGKKLSPRKIMMDTRDRLEEVGININVNKGVFEDDQKQLLNDYISPEELWACTSCNACVEACPVAIDPLSIIMDMRQYLVMEQSAAPKELNAMMGNIENNGAPWPFSNQDRLQWINEK